jgi:hypothetical protein
MAPSKEKENAMTDRFGNGRRRTSAQRLMAELKSAKFDQKEQIGTQICFPSDVTPKEHLDLGLVWTLDWPMSRDKGQGSR